MNWQEQLITTYLYVCKHYHEKLWVYCQRMSNHSDLSFTDEEVITIYLFGIIDGKTDISKIYKYTDRHLRAWFPKLPSYEAYVQRLNKVSEVFAPLLEMIVSQSLKQGAFKNDTAWIMDSFPVALAKQGHRFNAKVAPDIASTGYCSSKNLYFYGVRVHIVGRSQPRTLPYPEYIGVIGANMHDAKAFEQISPELFDNDFYGDKAFKLSNKTEQELYYKQHLIMFTPIKKKKGQKCLDAAEKLYSTAVSKIRQPIESLFAWLDRVSGIESASKVRSTAGLMVHIFGRLAAAIFFWSFLRISS